ncbi:MAG: protease modulator HflC [Alphaproteobacteria bacterium]|nr:protease modulator HflC [Alphaproteobacteria bacterium]MBP7757930.1 protease modulator HflC [Alphaproteobacteria bacterium]MBP7761257.1 protease modulator HflC [Alphaproteobacteria bacterium]
MRSFILLAVLAVGTLVLTQSLFIVDQTQQAIVLQLGQPLGEPRGPGLHWKTPFIQNVQFFDRRILSVDPPAEQVVISSTAQAEKTTDKNTDQAAPDQNGADEKAPGPTIENVSGEPIIVDTFARYKITDPLQFLKTLRTIESANARLESILNDSSRSVLGRSSLTQLLSPERAHVMTDIKKRVNEKISKDQLGIEIVDVRIVRADLTPELRESTVRQMISQLKERATERRAKGEEKALEIVSTADKEKTVLIAEAERKAQVIKGEGDQQAIKIYAEAFNVDKEFYSFLRSMEAYRNTLASPETRLILSPNSEFFRYFEAYKSRSE